MKPITKLVRCSIREGGIFFFLLVIFCFSNHSIAQTSTADSSNKNFLNLYLDCQYCYNDYIKTEIKFVNYVRDRKECDVDLLIAEQNTGSNGTKYTLMFLGQNKFANQNDTLIYNAASTNTDDQTRSGLVHILKMGLMSFVAKTSSASQINIDMNSNDENTTQVTDKWKSWVFNIGAGGNFDGSKNYVSDSYRGNLSANKTTDKWKVDFGFRANRENNKYYISSLDTTYTSNRESKSFNGMVVKSLSSHWSAGLNMNAGASTYSNKDLYSSFFPGVEYDVFPYSKSTDRLITFLYTAGPEYYIYSDTTIYNKTSETLFSENLSLSFDFTQKWGSLFLSVDASNYFHDFSKNHLSVYGNVSWKIFKGLSFHMYSSFDLTHDQLSLPKSGASEEEILLQQKELASRYNYYMGMGFSYQFGSIFNNCVNPRFGSNRSFYF